MNKATALVAALALVTAVTTTHSYSSYAAWPSLPVTFYVNPTTPDLIPAAAVAATQFALNVWTTQGMSPFGFAYGGTSSDTTTANDGRNVVIFRNASNGSAIASTYSWWDGSNHLVDSDVVVWDAGFTFFSGTSGCVGSGVYLEDVLTHEFGHALGLNHSSVADATMYPSYSYCSQEMRTLASDDIAGVQSLYGVKAPTPDPTARLNVAASANGATAFASSSYSAGYSPSGAINGDRRGASWGVGAGWNDGTAASFPDWLEIDFAGTKTIDEVDIFSLQDAFWAPVEPTAGLTFTQYGLTDFTVQYWTGFGWQAVPGGVVSGNTLVWRTVAFAPVATSKIRLLSTGARDGYWSRVVEVEAYQTSAAPVADPRVNVAGAGFGAIATASSTYGAGFEPIGSIDGDRRGTAWGSGGGWNDATPQGFPDWLQVDFAGVRTIDEVDVFSVQDAYWAPGEPSPSMTFSQYGLTDFTVQYWTGTAWQTIPGGAVSSNSNVWRAIAFAPITTSRIRVVVTRSSDGLWSRVTEIEAYGTTGGRP